MKGTFNEKASYDLAIEYAKISLQHAMSNGTIYFPNAPKQICEMEHFATEFVEAYCYFKDAIDISALLADEEKRGEVLP